MQHGAHAILAAAWIAAAVLAPVGRAASPRVAEAPHRVAVRGAAAKVLGAGAGHLAADHTGAKLNNLAINASVDDVDDDRSRALLEAQQAAVRVAKLIRAELSSESAAPAPSLAAFACGLAPKYKNAKTTEYKDSQKTFYNKKTDSTDPVNFVEGDEVEYTCSRGYSTDGAKDGNATYKSKCTKHGYFKPEGVCMKASKCGAVPNITNAAATGTTTRKGVEFACNPGHSLDGKEVVAGGLGKNSHFIIECVQFSGQYKEFDGECKAYSYIPTSEVIRMYKQVFKALFAVGCKGELNEVFGNGTKPELSEVCTPLTKTAADCSGLVSTLKGEFTTKLQEKEDAEKDKDWDEQGVYGEGGVDVKDAVDTFCTDLWDLLDVAGQDFGKSKKSGSGSGSGR